MKRFASRSTHVARWRGLVGDRAALAAVHADTEVPDQIGAWIARLSSLYGVPFDYLVADPALLPVESIRFFYVDPSWITALVEGAFSLGDSTTGDAMHTSVLASKLHGVRADAGTLATGFVLRSRVVSDWPGIEVQAFDAAGTPLAKVLRMETITPGLLLFIVAGELAMVEIREPSEGLHFGVPLDSGGNATVTPRWVTPPAGTQIGSTIANGVIQIPSAVRDGGKRVLKIGKLATAVTAALATHEANTNPDGTARAFTGAEMGLQMVEDVQAVRFTRGGSR